MSDNEDLSPELLLIRDRFIESLPEKVAQLKKAKLEWEADDFSLQSHTAIETMFHVTHQLTGTAGSVGFTALSNMARDINHILRRVQETDQTKLEEELTDSLSSDLENLTKAVENCYL